MLKNIVAATVVASLIFWMPMSAVSSPKSQCLDGRLVALKVGGFSGPLLCDSERISFKLVGTIPGTKQSYLIYNYRYQFLPKGGNVLHGGQRLVVLSSKGKYLGQYALTPPPQLDVVVNHSSIVISVNREAKGVIEFKGGPPPSAYVDGERITFFK